MPEPLNCWTELNLPVVADNIRAVRSALAPSCELILVVKANAYGNGMLPVAKCARQNGVGRFAVAHLHEAVELRAALPEVEIILLGVLDCRDVAAAARIDVVVSLVSRRQAVALARVCGEAGVSLRCHVNVDTGMGRFGIPYREVAGTVSELNSLRTLRLEGVYSHFAESDSPDADYTFQQFECFKSAIQEVESRGVTLALQHVANSNGIQQGPQWDLHAARCGMLVYGYEHRDEASTDSAMRPIKTRPCLQWKTRVMQVRHVPAGFSVSYGRTYCTSAATTLATIDAGYADGFPRLLSNRGHVLIRGRRYPVVGRVTMNATVVDVGDCPDVQEGDSVTLLGQDGEASLWADEMAGLCQTISYEILTGIQTADRRVIEA